MFVMAATAVFDLCVTSCSTALLMICLARGMNVETRLFANREDASIDHSTTGPRLLTHSRIRSVLWYSGREEGTKFVSLRSWCLRFLV